MKLGIFEICNEVSTFLPYHVCALNWNSLIVSTTCWGVKVKVF